LKKTGEKSGRNGYSGLLPNGKRLECRPNKNQGRVVGKRGGVGLGGTEDLGKGSSGANGWGGKSEKTKKEKKNQGQSTKGEIQKKRGEVAKTVFE